MTLPTEFKSPLHQTVSTTKTDFWNDSCSLAELTYAIEHGAVGATKGVAEQQAGVVWGSGEGIGLDIGAEARAAAQNTIW